MSDISVKITYTIDGRMIEMDLDDTMTSEFILEELISAEFIENGNYFLITETGETFDPNKKLKELKIKDNISILVIPKSLNHINVHILHPTDGRILDVELDDRFTPPEIIHELVQAKFINTYNYVLAIKGASILDWNKAVYKSGVRNNTVIRIIPNTKKIEREYWILKQREENLLSQLQNSYELLSKWEERYQLADNPNEETYSKKQIDKQKKIIEGYLKELSILRTQFH